MLPPDEVEDEEEEEDGCLLGKEGRGPTPSATGSCAGVSSLTTNDGVGIREKEDDAVTCIACVATRAVRGDLASRSRCSPFLAGDAAAMGDKADDEGARDRESDTNAAGGDDVRSAPRTPPLPSTRDDEDADGGACEGVTVDEAACASSRFRAVLRPYGVWDRVKPSASVPAAATPLAIAAAVAVVESGIKVSCTPDISELAVRSPEARLPLDDPEDLSTAL